MSLFPVTTTKEKELREKMDALNIREEDIEESFIRSGGKGGQLKRLPQKKRSSGHERLIIWNRGVAGDQGL